MTKQFNLYFMVDVSQYDDYFTPVKIYTTKKLKECTRIVSFSLLCRRGKRLFKLTNTPKVQKRTIVLNEGKNKLGFEHNTKTDYTVCFTNSEVTGVTLCQSDSNIIKKLGLNKLSPGESLTLQFKVLKCKEL